MHRAKAEFDENLKRINDISAIITHLTIQVRMSEMDVGELLRSQIVYAVSALDKLIHELIKTGMIYTYQSLRAPTGAYKKYTLSLDVMKDMHSGLVPAENVLEQHIMLTHKHLAFQDPDKVSQGLSLIWAETHKWAAIASSLGGNEADIKTRLKNIVARRNQIVHEADRDLSSGLIQPISRADTNDIVDFITRLGNAIYSIVL
jgi:hypothetical protein